MKSLVCGTKMVVSTFQPMHFTLTVTGVFNVKAPEFAYNALMYTFFCIRATNSHDNVKSMIQPYL